MCIDLKTVKRGRISEYAEKFGCEYHAGKKPWAVKADVAFPCATQNEIDEGDASELVRNGVLAVVEGANMPTTPAGAQVFHNAKTLHAPSKASNAGGVAVSGFERTQNSQYTTWSRAEVDRRLQEIMKRIHNGMRDPRTEFGLRGLQPRRQYRWLPQGRRRGACVGNRIARPLQVFSQKIFDPPEQV